MTELSISKIGLKDLINSTLRDPGIISRLIEKKGDVFTFRAPFLKGYVFANPTYIKHVFSHKPHYVRHPKIIHITQRLLGLNGLLTIEDLKLWKTDREVLNTLFGKNEMKRYVDIMVHTFEKHYDTWQKFIDQNVPLNISEHFTIITLTNLLNTVFGGVRIDTSIIPSLSRELFYLTSPPIYPYVMLFDIIPMPFYFRFKKAKKKLISIGDDIIKQSFTNQTEEENLIKVLAKANGYREYTQLDKKMLQHLNAEALTFLLAGHDTTAAVLVHASVFSSLYPLVFEKAYAEVRSVLGSRNPTYEDLSKLSFTRAIIQETLRLWPPGSYLIRTPQDEDEIEGHRIRKNDMIIIPTFAIQRHGKYWPNPEGFDPERFMNPLTREQQILYMPFGKGPQACIGSQFAVMQATLGLAMLLQRYRLTLTPGVSLERDNGMVNRLNMDITMNVKRLD